MIWEDFEDLSQLPYSNLGEQDRYYKHDRIYEEILFSGRVFTLSHWQSILSLVEAGTGGLQIHCLAIVRSVVSYKGLDYRHFGIRYFYFTPKKGISS